LVLLSKGRTWADKINSMVVACFFSIG
jgi:hypothetical protein